MQVAQPRPNTGTSSTHSRSSSFFSGFRKQSNPPATASDMRRTPSLNGSQRSGPPPSIHPQPQEPSSSIAQDQPLPPPPRPTQSPPQSQPPQQNQLHPEIRSVVQLTAAHSHKTYVSGKLIRRVERDANGHRPAKDEGWVEVWAQLGGTTLSIWDMKAINEASQMGKEVPPTYINMTDAFVQVLGAITIPIPGTNNTERQENVLTLNTAGSNLLFFACPSPNSLVAWASALRLSSWEKSRLEEIYTAHLIRITLSSRDIPTTLIRGKLEGWVRVRIAGQTDWKSLWVVIHSGQDGGIPDEMGRVTSGPGPGSNGTTSGQGNAATARIKRMSNLFSATKGFDARGGGQSFPVPTIAMYTSQKPKDKKTPLLTMTNVSQAFAVYPERPELITRSTLIKLEGVLGTEEMAGGMRGREGWLLVMPQLESDLSPAAEMLKWVIALHDSFKLYGRPQAWTWDPREPQSLMFAYPVGPQKDQLFLEREAAEVLDPREDRTSVIRSKYVETMRTRMERGSPALPPQQHQRGATTDSAPSRGYQLPPLSFDGTNNQNPAEERHLLTPITERSSIYTHGRSMSGDATSILGPKASLRTTGAPAASEEPILEEPRSPPPETFAAGVTGAPLSDSPRVSLESRSPPPPAKDISRTASALSGTGSARSATNTTRTSLDGGNSVNNARATSPLGSPASVPKSPSILANGGPGSSTSPSLKSIPLRSPYSPGVQHQPLPETPNTPPASILTSPYSPAPSTRDRSPARSTFSFAGAQSAHASASISQHSATASTASGPTPTTPTGTFGPGHQPTSSEDDSIATEAGALYYMQQQYSGNTAGRKPTPIIETDRDDDDGDDSSAEFPKHASSAQPPVDASQGTQPGVGSPVVRQGTPMAFVDRDAGKETSTVRSDSSPSMASYASNNLTGSRQAPLGRKPSGARAPQSGRMSMAGNVNVLDNSPPSAIPSSPQPPPRRPTQNMEDTPRNSSDLPYSSSDASPASPKKKNTVSSVTTPATDESSLDVLAALSYLDVTDPTKEQLAVEKTEALGNLQPVKPLNMNRAASASPVPSSPKPPGAIKSSFAPSNKAAERKAKAQAQQAAAAAAASRPGRAANGKRQMRSAKADEGAWSSEEEEEEEEEEEDEDNDEVDSDGEPVAKGNSNVNSSNHSHLGLHPQGSEENLSPQASHPRPPRNLPQPPLRQGDADEHPSRRPMEQYAQYQQQQQSPQHLMSQQFPSSYSQPQLSPLSQQYPQQPGRNTYYEENAPARSQNYSTPAPTRPQNMWNSVLDPGHSTEEPGNSRGTFVNLDEESKTMTKAFTPQGLLSAGLQDKQSRSAKNQEELARETGASLINVPNKPPPPQTGLLGAITAHERDRKREGGVGAALTEREREKRLAEDRQRRFDDAQRQQLDQMQQGGSMYGGQFGMNPMMMMNPMSMMGMNPMMTGGMNPMMTGGMNPMMMSQYGMMGGFNPQMMAAQQAAAQAYQQAMMTFSQAGSQAGGEGNNAGSPSLNPMMTGNMSSMGNMGMGMGMGMGFDPRMSMMSPMGMQMTGMSQFDPRFGPQNTGTPSPMNEMPPTLHPMPPFAAGQNISRSSSPARGSPLARTADTPEAGQRGSSPKPPIQ